MLFAQMMGLKGVWGCEDDLNKVDKADTALRKTYNAMLSPLFITKIVFQLVHASTCDVGALPDGASIIFSFWQGLSISGKQAIGRLARECPTFKTLCVVQNGNQNLDLLGLGFPTMTLVGQITVKARGNHSFQAYFFQVSGRA
jgi:hypothetical protein